MFLSKNAYAQGNITIDQPTGFQITDVGTLVSGLVGAALIIAIIIIFGFLAFGGILVITSSGDKTQTERGMQAVTGALVGLAVIAASWAVMLLLQYVFGIHVLEGISLPSFY